MQLVSNPTPKSANKTTNNKLATAHTFCVGHGDLSFNGVYMFLFTGKLCSYADYGLLVKKMTD